jgi:hypothetical protein
MVNARDDPHSPNDAHYLRSPNGNAAPIIGVIVLALLPTWLQSVPQSGCVWGDTVTQGSDTLTFAGASSSASSTLWVDTTAA